MKTETLLSLVYCQTSFCVNPKDSGMGPYSDTRAQKDDTYF